MRGEVVAENLAFPEGPVWIDGAVYFVEMRSGHVSRFTPGRGVERIAQPGGGPNGATLGPDQALYVTINGGMLAEQRTQAGIVRVSLDGQVEWVTREVAGVPLEGPNDLAFGPDGRLYFTDPRGHADPERNKNPGRVFAWDLARSSGELMFELGPVFPNGVAFDARGALIWTESFSRKIMSRRSDGTVETLMDLPERHFPDGFCVGADSRLYVATTYSHSVSIVENGSIVGRLECGDGMPTNCCFAATDLYVTESRRGTLWRFPLEHRGLPLRTGRR